MTTLNSRQITKTSWRSFQFTSSRS